MARILWYAGADEGLQVLAVLLAVDVDIDVCFFCKTEFDGFHVEFDPLDGHAFAYHLHGLFKIVKVVFLLSWLENIGFRYRKHGV